MKKLKLLGTVVILLFLASCGGGGGGGGGGGNGDTTPPTVLSTSPADGTTGVDVSKSVTATFSEAMDDSTITTSSFTLTLSSNSPVSGTVTYDSGTNTATFTPSTDLDYETTYTATITTGVTDLAGNSTASNYIWSFTTTESTVQLPETGQTKSYDANTPQKDDGALQAGVSWPSQRFADNGDGTVTDRLTGLMWLKNANCFDLKDWSTALSDAKTLANGTCGLIDGSNAGDWRLPNVNELESLVNAGKSDSAKWLNSQGFTNVQDGYWSSTTDASSTTFGWFVIMDGSVDVGDKAYLGYVWPVRSGQ